MHGCCDKYITNSDRLGSSYALTDYENALILMDRVLKVGKCWICSRSHHRKRRASICAMLLAALTQQKHQPQREGAGSPPPPPGAAWTNFLGSFLSPSGELDDYPLQTALKWEGIYEKKTKPGQLSPASDYFEHCSCFTHRVNTILQLILVCWFCAQAQASLDLASAHSLSRALSLASRPSLFKLYS